MDAPDTRYARTPDGVYLAYQTVGDGPIDIAWQFDTLGDVDLVSGSGLAFEDAGDHELKDVPDRWRLFRVVGASR